VSFKNIYGFEEGFNFRPKDSIFIHGLKTVGNANAKSLFLLYEQLEMIESGLLNEYLLVSEQNVIFVKLLFSVLTDDFLTLSLKIILSFKIGHIVMEAKNVVV